MSWSSVFFDLATHGGKAVIDHFSAKAKPQPQAAPVWPTLPTLPQMPQFELPRPPQVALPGVAVGAIEAPALHRSLPAEAAAPSYAEEFGMADDTSPVACWPCTRRHVNTALKAATATNLSPREAACTVMGEVAVWEQYDITEVKIRNTSPERRGAVLAAIPGMKRAAGCLQPPPASLHLAWAAAVEAFRFANSSGGNPSPMERREADLRMEDVQGWVGVADTLPLGRDAAPHLDAIRHARHRLNRDGNTPEAIAQMRDALRGAAVALTPEPSPGALAEAASNLQQARDAFYQGALGAMKQARAPQADVAPALKGRLYQDRETRIPARYMAYLQPTDGADILGETPQTRQAFHRLLTFAEGQGVTVREYPFPPDIEDGQVVALTFGAYAPDLGPKGAILLGPQVSAESPRAVETAGEEVMHSILDSNACNVWRTDQSKVAYEDQPEEQEAKLANLIALHAARVPFETDTGQRIDPRTVELDIAAMERSEDPRIVRRAKWAGAIGARVLAGESVTVGACPR